MIENQLSSLQNPLFKQMRKLQQAKYRHQQGQFLLEGTHLVQEACKAGWLLDVVCYTPAWQAKYLELSHNISHPKNRTFLVTEQVLQSVATTVHPDGVVAVAQSHPRTTAPLSLAHLGLVLETIQDPGNLGTLIRTAVATQVEGLLCNHNSVDLESPKVLRASAGAWFHLPMRTTAHLVDELCAYQQQGMQIVATVPEAPQTYWQVDYHPPTLILIGNEGAGLSTLLLGLADHQVSIPIAAGVESLNAAIAAALLLYEVRRQRSCPENR
ncbi:MAG: RNA methyltransferase [Acaryochloridaceae cyanobacterium CSU_3_4]|nr:RNA methyltransferase [Acaryochloridaceae cyanobacterium CSU_3_4]